MLTIICEYCKYGPPPGVSCSQCIYAGAGNANCFEPQADSHGRKISPRKKPKRKPQKGGKERNTFFGKGKYTDNGTDSKSRKKRRDHAPRGRNRDVPRT